LSYKDGTLCDYANLADLRFGASFGRVEGMNGFCHLDTPTPLKENSSGAYSIAPKPVLIGQDGVYDDVESVSVTLTGEGSIYYTTDGSVPTADSTPYTEPITLTKTTAIRAVNIMDGSLTSDTLDISYIINEGHDLPVVSLVSAPNNLTGGTGIYSNPTADWERPCSITLYDGAEGFSIEGGMKMHGATSRVAQRKKSFKINFRPRYEGDLQYDLFGNGITQFSSILLRAAQEDTFSTQIRDNLMHQLAIKACPELPSQDYKYCVLYINGQYWGLYNIREAHSTAHYANHYGYTEESVSMWKEAWPADSETNKVYWFMMNNDMRKDENYDYVAEHIDIESLIAWTIIEAYSGNLDCNSPNVRFYYSTEDDMMRFALVDLDLGMFGYDTFGIPLYTGYAFNNIPARLLDNEKFRVQFLTQLSEYLNGPLANENVLPVLDDLQSQIRSEIPRDRERWGGSLANWEHMLNNYLYPFVRDYGGRAKQLANAARSFIKMTEDEYVKYFGNVK